MQRRPWIAAATAALLGIGAGVARAQPASAAGGWSPTRPLRILAPGAPGAILDVAARQLAEHLGGFGQAVVVDNRPGAGGIAMMEAVARSAPDGHTVGIATFVELTVNPWLFDRLPYDPLRDIQPVTTLYSGPQLLVAHPGSGIASLRELIRLAREQPGRHAYGSSGVARPPHIFMERFKVAAGLDLPHIPYRGGPPLMQAVLTGEVPLAIEGTPSTLPLVKAGRLRALAVTGESRLAGLPDVPTFAEAGIDGMGLAWVALVAAAGTPAAALARWEREVAAALSNPALRGAYEAAGRTPVGDSAQALAARMRAELPRWRDVVRQAGIRPE